MKKLGLKLIEEHLILRCFKCDTEVCIKYIVDMDSEDCSNYTHDMWNIGKYAYCINCGAKIERS